MKIIRSIILAFSIVLLSSMAFAEEPTKKSEKSMVYGVAEQQEFIEKLQEKQDKKGVLFYKVFGVAVIVGFATVTGVMLYLRFKSKD